MSTTQSTVPLRTDALVEPVRRRDVKAFYRQFAARHPSLRHRGSTVKTVAVAIGALMLPIFLLAISVGVAEELEEGGSDAAGQIIGMASITGLMVVGCGLMAYTYVRLRRRRGTPARHYRLSRFAAENGMDYQPGPYNANHLTPWADRGRLAVTRVMRPVNNRRVEFANFELVTGSTSGRSTQFGGYCAIRLPTRLPHIVVKSKTGGASPLTEQAAPSRAQRLSLEGDFDSYFTLFCPEGYERDALYLFTPDIMARLVDSVNGYDVEIIDDWLFLIRTSDVVTLEPAAWVGLVGATNALLEKVGRWERWRDDRDQSTAGFVPVFALAPGAAGTVAAPGRRLRMTFGRGALIAGALAGLYLIATALSVVLR